MEEMEGCIALLFYRQCHHTQSSVLTTAPIQDRGQLIKNLPLALLLLVTMVLRTLPTTAILAQCTQILCPESRWRICRRCYCTTTRRCITVPLLQRDCRVCATFLRYHFISLLVPVPGNTTYTLASTAGISGGTQAIMISNRALPAQKVNPLLLKQCPQITFSSKAWWRCCSSQWSFVQ